MGIGDSLRLAFRDLGRRKKRTLLTSLGITIGTILIILMVSLGILLNQFLVGTINSGSNLKGISIMPLKADAIMPSSSGSSADIKDMNTWFKKNFKVMNNDTLEKINKINGVEGIKASISANLGEVLYNNNTYYGDFNVTGYNLKYDDFFKSDVENAKSTSGNINFKPIIAGVNLNESSNNDILIGESLLNKIGVTNPKNIVGKKLSINIDNINGQKVKPYKKTFTVIGVLSKDMPDGNKIVMNLNNILGIVDFLQYTNNFMDNNGYNSVTVEAKNINSVSTVVKKIKEEGIYAKSYQSQSKQMSEGFNNITIVLSVLGIIVICVAGIGIVNTMVMAVHERQKSIGVMKAIGANSTDIRRLFIVQSGAIGFVGSIIGAIISFVLFRLISFEIIKQLMKSGKSVEIIKYAPWWVIVSAIVFSIVVSVIAGIYPSNKAAKMDPIKALN